MHTQEDVSGDHSFHKGVNNNNSRTSTKKHKKATDYLLNMTKAGGQSA